MPCREIAPRFVIIRHDQSLYNETSQHAMQRGEYAKFLQLAQSDPDSAVTRQWAARALPYFYVPFPDAAMPLSHSAGAASLAAARFLTSTRAIPDVVVQSPYTRAAQTYNLLTQAMPELATVPSIVDDRFREIEHGDVDNYLNWPLYATFHPEERVRLQQEGLVNYRFIHGESMADVYHRAKSAMTELRSEFPGKTILIISHANTMQAIDAILQEKPPAAITAQPKPQNGEVWQYIPQQLEQTVLYQAASQTPGTAFTM